MQDRNLQALHDIQEMMAKSSRFLSLSGLSGITAGICALAGSFFAHQSISRYADNADISLFQLRNHLIIIGLLVFMAALIFAFVFTLRKSRLDKIPIGSMTSMRLLWNTFLPVGVGAAFILKLLMLRSYTLVIPVCLIFYGLALVNGSKYTLGEIKYLGYAELILGVSSLFLPTYGLFLWTTGFGILHIIYGFVMWRKYERGPVAIS